MISLIVILIYIITHIGSNRIYIDAMTPHIVTYTVSELNTMTVKINCDMGASITYVAGSSTEAYMSDTNVLSETVKLSNYGMTKMIVLETISVTDIFDSGYCSIEKTEAPNYVLSLIIILPVVGCMCVCCCIILAIVLPIVCCICARKKKKKFVILNNIPADDVLLDTTITHDA